MKGESKYINFNQKASFLLRFLHYLHFSCGFSVDTMAGGKLFNYYGWYTFKLQFLNYNQKENYDFTNFLMTYFCDWFTGKRENILKNYNVLPKDSLVSKDGLEADLERLRTMIGYEENS